MDLFREKHIPQTECGPSQKVRAAPGYGVVSFYRGGQFHRLMSERSIPAILGKGWGFPEIGSMPSFLTFMVGLGTVMVLVGVSFSLLL